MKTILLSINSKFIHTLLAPRYLKANCHNLDVEIYETNININRDSILRDIYLKQPDVIAISCYIFNIEIVRKLIVELKLILPNVKLILGGYEATFDVDRYLPYVDCIIKGEGDFAFNQLLHDIENGKELSSKIIEAGTICDLNKIASPYDEEYCKLGKDKILYFESSRGCPFQCSYCMSANSNGVRTFDIERTFKELKYIMSFQPKQIKFVDRTFNFDVNRANKIFQYIIDSFSDSSTNFHFEMAPEIFNNDTYDIIKHAKNGLFQFEIGVQTYNQKTLKEVGRYAHADIIEGNIRKLVELKNSHVHVDLIAGLPYEDLESFKTGFDRLFLVKANCLQLGFLKVLKGSKIYYKNEGIITKDEPPYEVISTPVLTYRDILELKQVEEMLETFYNSGRFKLSMDYLIPRYITPYQFFLSISHLYKSIYKQGENVSTWHLNDLLYEYAKTALKFNEEHLKELELLLNNDYINNGNARKWRRNI